VETERLIRGGDWRFLTHRLHSLPRRYKLSPIDAPRPVAGTVEAEVRCDECGSLIRCTLESPPVHRRRLLRRLLLIGAAVVAAHYAVFALVASAAAGDTTLFTTLTLIIESPLVIGGLLAGVFIVRDAGSADGVRLRHRSRRHSVRTRGSLSPDSSHRDTWVVSRDTSFKGSGL
jgi:hypothetical protein